MKIISLTQGKVALVDDWAYPFLARWKWMYKPSTYTGYAARDIGTRKSKKRIYMHQVVMLSFNGTEIDHIDQNGLNNQVENLRIATRSLQMFNSHIRCNNKSGIRNVTWIPNRKLWCVRMLWEGRYRFMGYFKALADAAKFAEQKRNERSVALRIEAGKDQRMANFRK